MAPVTWLAAAVHYRDDHYVIALDDINDCVRKYMSEGAARAILVWRKEFRHLANASRCFFDGGNEAVAHTALSVPDDRFVILGARLRMEFNPHV
jgi:hypothetical protein